MWLTAKNEKTDDYEEEVGVIRGDEQKYNEAHRCQWKVKTSGHE